MQNNQGLDRKLLNTLKTKATMEAKVLPKRHYCQRLNTILAIVAGELLEQMEKPNLPSRQGLDTLTQLPEWKKSLSLPKLEEPIPFSKEILSKIANEAQQALLFLPQQHILRPYYQELMKASASLLALQYDRSIFDL
jgi:hypothetical protein